MVPGIDPKVDYAFKRLFGSPHNIAILISLLHAVLRPAPAERIVELQLLNPFNDKDALDDKLSVVDLRARDQSGNRYTVEMQLVPHRSLPERILYYWSRFYQSQLHEGEDYNQLKPTIAIVFMDDAIFRDPEDCYHWTFRPWDDTHRRVLTPHLIVHLLELTKFRRAVGEVQDALDQWLFFLRHAEGLDTDQMPVSLTLPEITQALQELRTMHEIDYEREKYEDRLKRQRDARWFSKQGEIMLQEGREEGLRLGRQEGRQEGLQEGLQQGIQQGIQQGWVEIVQLCQGLLGRPITPVAELTALPPAELQQLADRLKAEAFARQPKAE